MTVWYVHPDGSDGGAGTRDDPFATAQHGINTAVAGDVIKVKAGTWVLPASSAGYGLLVSGNAQHGTGGAPITLKGWGGVATFDCSDRLPDGDHILYGLTIRRNWWVIDQIGIVNLGQPTSSDWVVGINMGAADDCIVRRCVVRDIGGIGLRVENASARNWIYRNDLSQCWDEQTGGENADGLSFAGSGTGNLYEENRIEECSDDGIDCWDASAALTIRANRIRRTGWEPGTSTASGNGNGIKLGIGDVGHLVDHNQVSGCRQAGITNNSSTGLHSVYNNTVIACGTNQFEFVDGTAAVLTNNLAMGTVAIDGSAVLTTNDWSATAADFESIADTGWDSPRGPCGELPDIPFLRLAPRSRLIDAGTRVGLAFKGRGPDIGAMEFQPRDSGAARARAELPILPPSFGAESPEPEPVEVEPEPAVDAPAPAPAPEPLRSPLLAEPALPVRRSPPVEWPPMPRRQASPAQARAAKAAELLARARRLI